jgi:hypothetical protein
MFCKKKNKEIENLKTEEKIEEKDVFDFKFGEWEVIKDEKGDLKLKYRATSDYIHFSNESDLESLLTLTYYLINRRKEEKGNKNAMR